LPISSVENYLDRNVRVLLDPSNSRLAEINVEASESLSGRLKEINDQLVAATGVVEVIEGAGVLFRRYKDTDCNDITIRRNSSLCG
jgi:hypothetical protein